MWSAEMWGHTASQMARRFTPDKTECCCPGRSGRSNKHHQPVPPSGPRRHTRPNATIRRQTFHHKHCTHPLSPLSPSPCPLPRGCVRPLVGGAPRAGGSASRIGRTASKSRERGRGVQRLRNGLISLVSPSQHENGMELSRVRKTGEEELNLPKMCPAPQTNSPATSSKEALHKAQPIPSLTLSNTPPKTGSASVEKPGTSGPPPYIHSHALPSALSPSFAIPTELPLRAVANATRDLKIRSGITALCFEYNATLAPPSTDCASAQILTRRVATLGSFASGSSAGSGSSSPSEAEEPEAESSG